MVASVRAPTAGADGAVPRFNHVVIVVMENKNFGDIIGRPDEAPYLNALSQQGVNFVDSFAITHPSQPNYIAMFSGSTQGVTNDDCPLPRYSGVPNLGSDLIAAGLGFAGFSESLYGDGALDCNWGGDLGYARKHNPWVEFLNVPATSNRTFADWPADYSQLPTVSYVVPNLCDDMHSCSRDTGDAWVQSHISSYAQWAVSNNSLLLVTFDEDNGGNNHIPTIMYGAHLRPGSYDEYIDHYRVLRTIEDMYGLPARGNAANRVPITDVWG
jgi:acid phosphatase